MEDLIKEAVETIKKVIEEKDIAVLKILLFGSRARGDFNVDSDWDFFVVIGDEISREEKVDITVEIKRKLVKLRIPNDIIIASVSEVEKRSEDLGDIVYYALKEGIEV
jgi:predicted nucleotidyltransferase